MAGAQQFLRVGELGEIELITVRGMRHEGCESLKNGLPEDIHAKTLEPL